MASLSDWAGFFYWIARIIQVGLALVAILLLIGALEENVLAFLVIAVVALVMFGIIGVVELLAVRPLDRRRGNGGEDTTDSTVSTDNRVDCPYCGESNLLNTIKEQGDCQNCGGTIDLEALNVN